MKKVVALLFVLSHAAFTQQHIPAAGENGTLSGTKEKEPLRSVTNPGEPTTQQRITPAGVQTVLQARIYAVAFGRDSSEVWLLRDTPNCCTRGYKGDLIRLNWKENRILDRLPIGGTPGLQGLAWDHGQNRLLATVIANGDRGAASILQVGRDALTKVADGFGNTLSGAPAGSLRRLIVPLTFEGQLAVLDADGKLEGKVPLGIAPFASVIDDTGNVAWVSNWGGRIPKSGELSAPLGESSDRAAVDTRGIAASGTVQRVDLNTRRVTNTIKTGLHPTALAWDRKRNRLYVANTNSDNISVIDTASVRVVEIVPLNFFDGSTFGIAPTALALSPDGQRLWVACGGINAVAQFRTGSRLELEGLIPTAYYPHTVAVSRDGSYILVGTFFGVGEGYGEKPNARYVGFGRSTAHVIAVPEPNQLADYTLAVAENSHLTLKGSVPKTLAVAKAEPLPVPRRPQDPSLMQHVVYIIKENWTYDSFFGTDPRGNGDPSLQLFGSDVVPNHRKLSEEFVLFDNFYSTGYSSQDGQAWMTQANATEYLILPGYLGRAGNVMYGQDPLTFSKTGFLWNRVIATGKTARIYGEFTAPPKKQHPDWTYAELIHRWERGQDFSSEFHVAPYIKAVASITAPGYPGFYFDVPDVIRAQIFLRDLAQWNAHGDMPNLVVLELPLDHTAGNAPGRPTPKAMVAANDLALGQIVEGLTKSKFWPHMAIFVAEDDGFNGLDHVDGRRVVALAVSPYIRRGATDSTFYSQTTMVKAMELMLGVPPLTLFDRIAADMRNAFTRVPDLTPYHAEIPRQSLIEENPKITALNGKERMDAMASAHMDFSNPDSAPMDELNRIIWHSVRGWNTAYPPDHRAAFMPADAGTGGNDDDDSLDSAWKKIKANTAANWR